MPRKIKKMIPEACTAVAQSGVDLKAYARAVTASQARMSSVACGEVAPVLADMTPPATSTDPRAIELAKFSSLAHVHPTSPRARHLEPGGHRRERIRTRRAAGASTISTWDAALAEWDKKPFDPEVASEKKEAPPKKPEDQATSLSRADEDDGSGGCAGRRSTECATFCADRSKAAAAASDSEAGRSAPADWAWAKARRARAAPLEAGHSQADVRRREQRDRRAHGKSPRRASASARRTTTRAS